jgi:hypothetical protein
MARLGCLDGPASASPQVAVLSGTIRKDEEDGTLSRESLTMKAMTRGMAALALLGMGFLVPTRSDAGPILDCLRGCPPPSYSPLRYWTPTLARTYDHCCGPVLSVYSPLRHPEVPAGYQILRYRCPAVPPAILVSQRPFP